MFIKAAMHIFIKDWTKTLKMVLYLSLLLVLNIVLYYMNSNKYLFVNGYISRQNKKTSENIIICISAPANNSTFLFPIPLDSNCELKGARVIFVLSM